MRCSALGSSGSGRPRRCRLERAPGALRLGRGQCRVVRPRSRLVVAQQLDDLARHALRPQLRLHQAPPARAWRSRCSSHQRAKSASSTSPGRASRSSVAPITSALAAARARRRSTSHRVRGRVPGSGRDLHAPRVGPGRSASRSVGAGVRPSLRRGSLRLADALDADVDARHLAADLVLDLLGDLGVRLQEVAGVLAALAQPRVAVVEPGARLR